ncbi:hypothetical protein [Streptomyces sp. NPDC048338]|uniref:hypothetical protein n=1 Tax=Streptomyces sp. NPDC048338 TaxID=3365536 RepID=UPI003716D379
MAMQGSRPGLDAGTPGSSIGTTCPNSAKASRRVFGFSVAVVTEARRAKETAPEPI